SLGGVARPPSPTRRSSDLDGTQCSVDFPLFRLADAYLIYAEAVLRGCQGGDMATAVTYVNELRERAFGNTDGNVSAITLDFILRSEEHTSELQSRENLVCS